jgi:hypothetical protein
MSAPERPTAPISLFYSYSHEDEALRKKLEAHLSLLQAEGFISGWHDRRIAAGTEWQGAIDNHLDEAGIILLLVSASFLASQYCQDVEVARAMQRHKAGTARVIPVVLRSVDWHTAPFGNLQALPKDGKPVASWKDRDKAFTDIARGIREAVLSLGAHNPSSSSRAARPVSTSPSFPSPTLIPSSRSGLLATLSRLDPFDFALLVAGIDDAALHVTRDAPVPKKAAELVEWAVSQGGPGLEVVRRTAQEVVPNFP